MNKLKAHQKALIAVVVFTTAALLLATAVWAYDSAQKDQIAPGVTVGGVDIGGRDVDEAREVIEDEVVAPLAKPVIVRFGGESYELTPKQLETDADVDGMIDEAVAETRDGGLFKRVSRYVQGSTLNTDIEPRVEYSDKAVQDFVADLAGEINQDAQNASIEPSGDRLEPTPGEKGLVVREREVQELVTEQVESPGTEPPVRAVVHRTKPEITTKELAEAYPLYVTVDRAAFRVRLFRNLKLAKSYTVAIGQAGYDTPTGLYSIESKEVNPTWHVPDSDWAGSLAGQDIPPGPGNPLVARWMGIYDGAGFHGTYETGSLGTAASHGCIRMAVDDVVEFFDLVEVGTPVYVQ